MSASRGWRLALLSVGFLGLSGLSPATAKEEVALRILPPRLEAVATHTGSYAGLGGAFVALGQAIHKSGRSAIGPGVAVYVDDPVKVAEAKRRSEARIPVAPPAPGAAAPGGFRVELAPAAMVLTLRHEGAYAGLPAAHARLAALVRPRGLRAIAPAREVYVQVASPGAAPVTEVQFVVEPRGRVDVGIYCGPGAAALGITEAFARLLEAGITARPIEAAAINDGSFRKQVGLLYVPGGWAAEMVGAIDAAGARHIEAFVRGGGGYAGVCAGSYFAAKSIRWDGAVLPYDVDLFPGQPEGPIAKIAPWPEYRVTSIRLAEHAVTKGLAAERRALYFGGPALRSDDPTVAVLARFEATGDPAVVAFPQGKGRVFLASVHLEYDVTGPRAAAWPGLAGGLPDLEPDGDFLVAGLRWALRR